MAKPRVVLPPPERLWNEYESTASWHRLGERYGCSADRVRKACVDAGYLPDNHKWSDAHELRLLQFCDNEGAQTFDLGVLSRELRRTVRGVTERARRLGCLETPGKRSKKDALRVEQRRLQLETLAGTRQPSATELSAQPISLTPTAQKPGEWKAGWYTIGERRIYMRSRWEPNYAFFLEWRKARGEISDWDYEPKTFVFEQVVTGTRAYKPDFLVTYPDGSQEWHEVKGWLDPESKTKLARMAKFFPDEKVVLIDERVYRQIEAKFSRIIPGWIHG